MLLLLLLHKRERLVCGYTRAGKGSGERGEGERLEEKGVGKEVRTKPWLDSEREAVVGVEVLQPRRAKGGEERRSGG